MGYRQDKSTLRESLAKIVEDEILDMSMDLFFSRIIELEQDALTRHTLAPAQPAKDIQSWSPSEYN